MDHKDIEAFQDSLKTLGIGGSDLALYVDFRPVYRYMTGFQNIEEGIPVNRDTMYRMFSMTKPVTCAAAMQLFEKGVFLLNDPVSDYLPAFADMKVRVGKDPHGICRTDEETLYLKTPDRPVEVQDLFRMQAGLDYELDTKELLELGERTDHNYTTAEFVDAVLKRPLIYEPGTHWEYSLAHDVLGRLIEIWSGMTFGEYLKKNIFEPLDMQTAGFHVSKEAASHYMVHYGLAEDGKTLKRNAQFNEYQLSPRQESGGAGLSMTLDDYARFACAMANRGVGETGERILAGRTFDLMRENALFGASYKDLFGWRPQWEGYGYGLGLRTLVSRAQSGAAGPVGECGWNGAWGTYTLFDPENRFALVFCEQASQTSNYVQRRLRNLAYAFLEWEGLI